LGILGHRGQDFFEKSFIPHHIDEEGPMPEFKFRGKGYNNPVELSLEILGGKWKMPILWRLKDQPRRYGALRRMLVRTSQKMLAQQLRELERDGLITRRVFPTVPPKVEYAITAAGRTSIPVIEILRSWGEGFRKAAA
jgi:DNA-binding HxlR family transcriptional regulator